MYNNHVAACFRLVSPLKIQEQQQEEENGCLMVMADPSDLGPGKNCSDTSASYLNNIQLQKLMCYSLTYKFTNFGYNFFKKNT